VPAEKATERAERFLVKHILDGTYPPGSELPGERRLSKEMGVARPALRSALGHLSRDGWLVIQQGKPTRVNDFMRDGNLSVLIALLHVDYSLLPDFIPNLLEVWSLLAPTYARHAVVQNQKPVAELLWGYTGLADLAEPYARAQWRLHLTLIDLTGNPIYGLILNSFADFYRPLAEHILADPGARARVRDFWRVLHTAALRADGKAASAAMRVYMQSLHHRWQTETVSELLAGYNQEPAKDKTYEQDDT
jgi:GntR family negative regulator for fad regulon and positive regulator of fabA